MHVGRCVAWVLVLGLSVSTARAQDDEASADEAPADEAPADEAAARVHFESGRVHHENGDYDAALREFAAAYELSGRPALLYNMYVAAERLGRLDEAIAHLERFLADGEPDAQLRGQLERRLENMRERRRAQSSGPPGTAVAPAQGGDVVPAAIAFGVAGAGLLSFAIFGGLVLAENGALEAGCGATLSCSDAEVADLSAFNVAADVSWVLAAAAATTGVILLVTLGLPSGERPREAAWWAPVVTPDGAGAAGGGRF